MTDRLAQLLALRHHLEIAHHVPGRIRLRFSISALNSTLLAAVDGVLAILRSSEGIESVRVNQAARSVVITYDRRHIIPDAWHTLVAGDEDAALGVARTHFAPDVAS